MPGIDTAPSTRVRGCLDGFVMGEGEGEEEGCKYWVWSLFECMSERERVCVCVCVCERERERECVCVCVFVWLVSCVK